jgi:hypothetical protein
MPSVLPFGGVVSGCQDGRIRIYRSSEGEGAEEEVFVLEGHRKGVISLSLTSRGHLLSGARHEPPYTIVYYHISSYSSIIFMLYTLCMHTIPIMIRFLGWFCATLGP